MTHAAIKKNVAGIKAVIFFGTEGEAPVNFGQRTTHSQTHLRYRADGDRWQGIAEYPRFKERPKQSARIMARQ
jgi:hypothetical protein